MFIKLDRTHIDSQRTLPQGRCRWSTIAIKNRIISSGCRRSEKIPWKVQKLLIQGWQMWKKEVLSKEFFIQCRPVAHGKSEEEWDDIIHPQTKATRSFTEGKKKYAFFLKAQSANTDSFAPSWASATQLFHQSTHFLLIYSLPFPKPDLGTIHVCGWLF